MRAPRTPAATGPFAAAALAAGLLLAPPDARASAMQPAPAHKPPAVSERIARDLAWSFGIVRIEEISLAGARWEVAGFDADGNEKLLDISAYDGRVLN